MNTDYRTPITYYSDPRTFVLKRKLGNDGLAALNFLWCWTAIHKANGILTGLSEDWIEAVSFWDGEHGKFVPTLLELEYLDQLEDGTYAIHNWAETNHWAAEAETRENKSRFSNMARFYPELYEELSAQGITGISRSDFVRLTAEYDRRGILDTSSSSSKKCDAYAPTPTPSPAPSPAPSPVPSTTPTPSPSRTPEPESVSEKTPKKTRKGGVVEAAKAATSSSSSFREKESLEILSQNPQAESATQAIPATPAESKDSIKPEKILVQGVSTEQPEATPVEEAQYPEATQAEAATPTEQKLSAEQYSFADTVEATVLDVLTQWNLQLARLGFPQVLRSTARREAAFKARVNASQERIYLAWWVALFDKIAASDFMCESARQKANWLTLDWVLKEQNMMKILEGKYDSERPVTAEIHGYAKTNAGNNGNTGTTARTKTQPTTIRRLTHEEISGPLMYKWEVENGYDAAGRKKSVTIEAEVKDTAPNAEIPALDAGEGENSRDTEEASYDLADFLDDDSTAEEESYDYGTSDSNEDEDLTLYGDSGLPTIRRTKGAF